MRIIMSHHSQTCNKCLKNTYKETPHKMRRLKSYQMQLKQKKCQLRNVITANVQINATAGVERYTVKIEPPNSRKPHSNYKQWTTPLTELCKAIPFVQKLHCFALPAFEWLKNTEIKCQDSNWHLNIFYYRADPRSQIHSVTTRESVPAKRDYSSLVSGSNFRVIEQKIKCTLTFGNNVWSNFIKTAAPFTKNDIRLHQFSTRS